MIRRVVTVPIATVAVIATSLLAAHPRVRAQGRAPSPPAAAPLEFEVVSIKRNTSNTNMMETRTLPDGTVMIVNGPLPIGGASPVPVLQSNIVGLPDWARTENYDFTARPPAGSTPEDRRQMMQTLFAKRMKLAGHVEDRETKVYSLVMVRSDGRLGPALRKSALDCAAASQAAAPPPGSAPPADAASRCGMRGSYGSIVSGGMLIDNLARNIQGRVGGPVANKTGLEGYYALTLKFAEQGPPAAGTAPGVAANPSDDPDFFTALQEQLGLKLLTDKGTVPYFVIDHIERPTDN